MLCPVCHKMIPLWQIEFDTDLCPECRSRGNEDPTKDPKIPFCPICKDRKLISAEENARKACDPCALNFAIRPPAPWLRPLLPCQPCGHPQIIRARVRQQAVKGQGEYSEAVLAPLAVTYPRAVGPEKKGSLNKPDEERPIGRLEAYVCSRCGFTEWYTEEPNEIPIGPEYGTEIMDAGGKGPYR
jgi:hypothetical protein